jgi:hypothetical protein
MDKIITGYTGNQNLPNDGAGLGYGTWANSQGSFGTNSYPYIDFNLYKDVNFYPVPPQWAQKLGTGEQAVLYSGVDPAVTDVHFSMMKTYGVHGATVERFLLATTQDKGQYAFRNRVLANVASSALKYGRLFYVFYDLSGCENNEGIWLNLLKNDFETAVKRYTTNPSWAKHQGKPAILLWAGPHEINQTNLASAISYFQGQGFSVVLGVAQNFRADFKAFWTVYAKADVIMVWCNGVSYQDDMNGVFQTAIGDAIWCHDRNLDYQFLVCAGPPVSRYPNNTVYTPEPTHAIENLKMWTHYIILSALRLNFTKGISIGGFLAMFDDYPEIEPLIVTAPDVMHLPGGKPNWWTMDAIGTPLSYDYNLRLSQKSVQLLSENSVINGSIPIPFMVPLPPSSLNRTILAGNTVISQKSSTVMEVASLIPNNYYEGCYADEANRDLWAGNGSAGSVEACASFCQEYYTPYFGVQNGGQCYCGYSYGTYGTSTGCTVKCSGNPGETCGGAFANSVYRVQYDVQPLTVTYIGCYGDSSTQRDLNVQQPGIGTIQECAGYCFKYDYFGVQFGSQCFCGNSYGKYGASKACTSDCSGNSTQTCGGANANSIYSYSTTLQLSTSIKIN